MVQAIKQVAGPSFFALLVIAVSFIPVITLEAQEGRLFRPLAYTKTLVMLVAAVLAITLDPALRLLIMKIRAVAFRPSALARAFNAVFAAKIVPEERHGVSRFLMRIYEPAAAWSLNRKWLVIACALGLVAATVPVYLRLGSEFMPPLEEGTLLYMPSTMPGLSIAGAQRLLQMSDRVIAGFPEVDRVFGKAGRAETSTDPAPLSMLETVITLKPKSRWRRKATWYSSWAPSFLTPVLRRITPDNVSQEDLVKEMNEALRFPGVANGWTMPIKGRIEMLSTGLRTPVGLKVSGGNIRTIEEIGARIEGLLADVRGTRSVFAERTGTGYFLDFTWNRDELARYGVAMEEAQSVVSGAIGGENVTTTIEGRERYAVNVRYLRDFRSDASSLGRVLVPVNDGQAQIPLSELAGIQTAMGASMIRDENGMLAGYISIDLADRDPASYIKEASHILREKLTLPAGYTYTWSGQHEGMERVRERLRTVVPLTLLFIFLLLYLNTRSIAKTAIVLLAVPFSAVGAIWFLYLLGYNMSIGVWVGLIALLGVDAETGVFMLLYLDLAYASAAAAGRLKSAQDLRAAVMNGAVRRLRPKFMTVATMFLGLVPVMWSQGTGADVMKRIAAPMIGGIFTSFILELIVYPAVFELWKWHFDLKKQIAAS